MKIAHIKLAIATASATVLVLLAATFAMAQRETGSALRASDLSRDVFRQYSELRYVLFEYLLYRHDRPREQWYWKHDAIAVTLVRAVDAADPRLRDLSTLLREHRSLRADFDALVRQISGNLATSDAELQWESEARLVTRILEETQSNIVLALGIARNSESRVLAAEERTTRIAALLILTLLAIILGNLFFFFRAVLAPLGSLRDGMRVVAAGDLEYRLPVTGGNEIGVLAASFNEMTERLRASRLALEAENAERRRAEVELGRTAAELRRSNVELEQFAYVTSHDLQEPLRMVVSYLQLIERRYRNRLDKDADEFIGFAVDGATRMRQLINDILDFSRVGSRAKPFAPTDSATVVRTAVDSLRSAIDEARAEITVGPLPALVADASQLAQVFQNLISNAIKFRRGPAPRIEISAQRNGGQWEFAVRDDGIGIAPEHAGRVFGLFQRLNTRREYPGTGIGLAICKKIVERHGGEIRVESRPGEGSTFLFTIPDREKGAA